MKRRILSLALALALCLGLSVPAAAAPGKRPETVTFFDSTQISGVLFYGSSLDAVAAHLPGIPVICTTSATVKTLKAPESFFGQTEQAYNEGDESYLEVGNFHTLDDEVIFEEGSKIDLPGPGKYVISISYPEDVDEFGNGGNVGQCFVITVLDDSAPAMFKDPFNPFSDVPATSPYADGVKWASKTKITTGKTADLFGPNDICTVSHILTFLYRAYTMYDDVETTGSEREAVLAWAKEKGLITGGEDLSAPCTRAMAVTYMWKGDGSPEPYDKSSFTDVPENAPYKDAVDWAVGAEITSGTGDGSTFSPNNTCTRGQIVTLLFRAVFDGEFWEDVE